MDDKKQDQINQFLRNELALIIQKEFQVDPRVIIVVNRVFFDEAQKLLKAFVSIFPDEKEAEILSLLKEKRHDFLLLLREKVRYSKQPKKLWFVIDDVRKHAMQVEHILDKIQKEK